MGTAGALPGRNGVNSGDLVAGAVKSGDIAQGAVTADKIGPRSIRGQHFPDVVIESRVIADSTFLAGDIARSGKKLGAFHVASNAIQSGEVSNNSLTGSDIEENSLGLGGAYADRTSSLGLASSFQTVLSRAITTAAPAQLTAVASVQLSPDAVLDGDYNASCMIEVDGLYRNPEYSQKPDELDFGSFAVTFGRTVFPGDHTVALRCRKTLSPNSYVEGGMTVVAVPLA